MKKILVVDDNLFMRYHMKKIIEESDGFVVIGEATNGKEAIEKMKELNPDIITLDLTMPVMDGIEFLEYLNKEKIKMKVIVVSALGQAQHIKKAIKLGAANFLVKPYNKEKLLNILKYL